MLSNNQNTNHDNSGVVRTIDDLVNALTRQLRLLRNHMDEAFVNKNSDYIPEVAAQLRILVIASRSNRPLLVDLMNKTGISVPLYLDDKPVGLYPKGYDKSRGLTLPEYMKLTTYSYRQSNRDYVHLTKADIVCLLSEKLGGAHVDWTLPDKLVKMMTSPLLINETPVLICSLYSIAQAVYDIGSRFIIEYERHKND